MSTAFPPAVVVAVIAPMRVRYSDSATSLPVRSFAKLTASAPISRPCFFSWPET
jgi:hypothetical protein